VSGVGIGQRAHDFELEGTDGPFRLSDHLGERVVLLFYPGDNTPVCTKQFCSYAERADDMRDLPATVIGISSQGIESHREFQAKNSIPVPLLADVDKSVAKAYGACAPVVGTRRAVIVVDEAGTIRHHHVHRLGLDFQTVDQIRAVLEDLPEHAGSDAARA
jgi:thioredoxin-dependent peroxiredoxin